MENYIKLIALSIICSVVSVSLRAQQPNEAKSRVVNEYNQPIQGAILATDDGNHRSVTAKDGTFHLVYGENNQYVVVSAPGYQNVRLTIGELAAQPDIMLAFDPHQQGGSVNFGYQAYTRESLTGAVSSVSGSVL